MVQYFPTCGLFAGDLHYPVLQDRAVFGRHAVRHVLARETGMYTTLQDQTAPHSVANNHKVAFPPCRVTLPRLGSFVLTLPSRDLASREVEIVLFLA